MIKIKLIQCIVLCACVLFSACQSPIGPEPPVTETPQPTKTDYSMDFEEEDDFSGILMINNDNGENTQFGVETNWTIENNPTPGAAKSGNRYICSYYNSDKTPNDDWLILPLMRISDMSQLTFYAAPYDANCSEEIFDVMISQEINVEQWPGESLLHVEFPLDTDSWEEFSIDLSAFSGQEMYIAFHCTSVYQYYLRIDDITVTNVSVL